MDVPPVPDAFVVNIGDLLEQWTNGVFKSTRHRVVNLVPGRERYSCAFFTSPDYDAVVRTPAHGHRRGGLQGTLLCDVCLDTVTARLAVRASCIPFQIPGRLITLS